MMVLPPKVGDFLYPCLTVERCVCASGTRTGGPEADFYILAGSAKPRTPLASQSLWDGRGCALCLWVRAVRASNLTTRRILGLVTSTCDFRAIFKPNRDHKLLLPHVISNKLCDNKTRCVRDVNVVNQCDYYTPHEFEVDLVFDNIFLLCVSILWTHTELCNAVGLLCVVMPEEFRPSGCWAHG